MLHNSKVDWNSLWQMPFASRISPVVFKKRKTVFSKPLNNLVTQQLKQWIKLSTVRTITSWFPLISFAWPRSRKCEDMHLATSRGNEHENHFKQQQIQSKQLEFLVIIYPAKTLLYFKSVFNPSETLFIETLLLIYPYKTFWIPCCFLAVEPALVIQLIWLFIVSTAFGWLHAILPSVAQEFFVEIWALKSRQLLNIDKS